MTLVPPMGRYRTVSLITTQSDLIGYMTLVGSGRAARAGLMPVRAGHDVPGDPLRLLEQADQRDIAASARNDFGKTQHRTSWAWVGTSRLQRYGESAGTRMKIGGKEPGGCHGRSLGIHVKITEGRVRRRPAM
jgi:hypothetical protein